MPRGPMGGRRAVEEPHDFGKVMGKLVNYCRNYLPVIIIALILGAAGTVCQIVGPDKLKDMTNEIVKGLPAIVNGRPVMNSVDFGTVGHIAWTLVALYVGYAVLGYVQSWMMANVTQRTAQRLRESISVKINKLPLKYFDKVSYGDVLSRITNDVDAIGQTLGQSLGSLITSVTLFVGALVMMFYNNVIMTLCAIGASLIGLIIMMAIMKSSQKYFARQQMALGDVNGHVEEMYAGHLIVKAYNGEADSIRRFEKYNSDLYESGWKSQFLSGLMMPLMNFVGNFGYVVVCVVGAALALDGQTAFNGTAHDGQAGVVDGGHAGVGYDEHGGAGFDLVEQAVGLVALVVVVIGDDATVHIDAEATGEIVEAARVFGGHDIGPFQEGHQTG